ncbi:ATP-binding cassette domain-containing protein [Gulosibacter faecalis]|uniref:ABC transporter ATP-binding protein n=1 Tax=Gulosibacter faecalis TaxID=272240 RepID=A0ABW5UYF1_9MICO
MTAIETQNVTKRYRDVTAIDDVTISLEADRIYGLLGRNGAGKTTLMKLLTGQQFASSGTLRVFGENPVENAGVLSRTAFIQESQKYPDTYRPRDLFTIAAGLYPNWSSDLADDLIDAFQLPLTRNIPKLSRGQLSAVGIIVGLASRAPLTIFDEPYLGLDAVARRLFFDRLLADYSEHPRTVLLSTHHIDEVANLLEHVVLLDRGRVLADAPVEDLQDAAVEVSGRAADVRAFAADRETLSLKSIGSLATAAVLGDRDENRAAARAAGLDVTPISLQDYVVHLTTREPAATAAER